MSNPQLSEHNVFRYGRLFFSVLVLLPGRITYPNGERVWQSINLFCAQPAIHLKLSGAAPPYNLVYGSEINQLTRDWLGRERAIVRKTSALFGGKTLKAVVGAYSTAGPC